MRYYLFLLDYCTIARFYDSLYLVFMYVLFVSIVGIVTLMLELFFMHYYYVPVCHVLSFAFDYNILLCIIAVYLFCLFVFICI